MQDTIVRNPFVDYLSSLRTQERAGTSGYVDEQRRPLLEALQRQNPWMPGEAELDVATPTDALVAELRSGKTSRSSATTEVVHGCAN